MSLLSNSKTSSDFKRSEFTSRTFEFKAEAGTHRHRMSDSILYVWKGAVQYTSSRRLLLLLSRRPTAHRSVLPAVALISPPVPGYP